ncbi:CHAP domain-containing protein [Gemmata sp.]|uniref:CHAP domain-containing protein n=1 Tax=Gemmata sp. TaxID=1914242 RepID=UPI003F71E613
MSSPHLASFFPAACAGLGLFLVGVANLLLLGRGASARAAATVAASAAAVGAAVLLDQPGGAATAAVLLAAGLVPVLALGHPRVVAAAARAVAASHHPAARYGLLAAVGVVSAVGAVALFDRADERAKAQSMADMNVVMGARPSVPSDRARAATDRGTPVVLREPVAAAAPEAADPATSEERFLAAAQLSDQIIRRGCGGAQTNCHGWVFTGGRFRLSADDVAVILAENGYREVAVPAPGDAVVYRTNGAVTHTGVVRYVTPGEPVLIESKWGDLGVFLHAAERSPYGTDFTFHRSDRRGHTLAGLTGPMQ